MKTRLIVPIICCLLAFLALGSNEAAGESAAGDLIRIGILNSRASVTLLSSNPWQLVDPSGGNVWREGGDREELTFRAEGSRVIAGPDEFSACVRFIPGSGGAVRVNNASYRGLIELRAAGDTLTVINILPLEEYLYGVLPKEIPAAWPAEALRAQAIVSRTYALASKGRYDAQGYDLTATISSQVYGGLDGEHPNTSAAIDATRGMILTYNGNIITAVFHASSGGYTENNEDVWQGSPSPYLRAVSDNFDSAQTDNPHRSWQTNLSLGDIAAKLAAGGRDVGEVYSVAGSGEKTASGRQREIIVRGSKGSQEISAVSFRNLLGLKSTYFDIVTREEHEAVFIRSCSGAETVSVCGAYSASAAKKTGAAFAVGADGAVSAVRAPQIIGITRLSGGVELLGQGWGHGVGMSQWGARGMALQGYNCTEILQHYYQEVAIETR